MTAVDRKGSESGVPEDEKDSGGAEVDGEWGECNHINCFLMTACFIQFCMTFAVTKKFFQYLYQQKILQQSLVYSLFTECRRS